MGQHEHIRYAFARAGVLLLSGCSIWVLESLPPTNGLLRAGLLALLVVFMVTLVVPGRWQTAPLQLGLLAVDLTSLCVIGCILVAGSIPGSDARIPFATAYLMATLVAVVGQRALAGLLGALGGAMILAVGTTLSVTEAWTPQPVLLGIEVLLLLCTSFLTVWIAGNLTRKARALELDQHVQREIRQREAAAAELVSFAQALGDASSLTEIAEAVLRHLRCHTQLSARAVVLESEGEDVALWEEAARLDADHVERRRLRLQESLSRVGSQFIIRRLQCHATSIETAEIAPQFKTAVDIPVKIDGRVAGVLLLADPAPDALPADRIGVLVDVGRRAGEAIRRLERVRDNENRRTALLLRQMREGVLLLGADGSVLLANPAARKALQAAAQREGPASSPVRIGDLTLSELADTPPGVSRRFRATYLEPGSENPTQLACTAISVLDRGHRIGTLVTLADVTDEELARNRIIQTEKMTLVGQTLAGVAHELNNPLAALIGYADLLRGHHMTPDVEKPVQQMREQALRATRIVRNLLNFARRRNPERVPTSLRELIEGITELFAYEARLANTELQVSVAPDLPPVLADKHSLQQVLVNLVQNSLHALQDWNGPRRLRIAAASDENNVTLSVTDSGPGIPEELRNRVFESFFTTKGSNKGTGLGLALSRSIARNHGGDLLLAPDTGGGASFTLRLPRYRPDGNARPVRLRGAAGRGGAHPLPQRILIVDDEASVRETLVAQLGAMGAHVDSAANGTEAQNMIRRGSYEVLIVDMRMPGISGLELHARLLESHPFLADRVVFITGDIVNDDLLVGAKATGRILLEKPFTVEELATALRRTAAGPSFDERISA